MRYKTPAALEMAVKAAAKASPLDTGLAISAFYYHRLLCRVFSAEGQRFVLKGGLSVLARTVDARATRDIDLLAREMDPGVAVEELKRLASIDLGDFVVFRFDRAEPIKAGDECRSGTKVWFVPELGGKPLAVRKVSLPATFSIPDMWFESYEAIYEKMARQARADGIAPDLASAQQIARTLYAPALGTASDSAKWSPGDLRWLGKPGL